MLDVLCYQSGAAPGSLFRARVRAEGNLGFDSGARDRFSLTVGLATNMMHIIY